MEKLYNYYFFPLAFLMCFGLALILGFLDFATSAVATLSESVNTLSPVIFFFSFREASPATVVAVALVLLPLIRTFFFRHLRYATSRDIPWLRVIRARSAVSASFFVSASACLGLYKRHIILPFVLLFMALTAQAQVSITSQVPLTAIDICGAPSTFSVTINCGAATNSNTLSINQPPGMHYIPGSVIVTTTNAGITVTENTISPDEDPVFNIGNMAPGNNVTFTYQAKADCQLIGVNNNNNTLTFNGSAGSPAPHVTNGYNTRNGVMNITGVTNNSYLNRTLGDTYNRVISVRNGGQGSVTSFTLNIANGNGFQIQSITGGTPSAALPAQSTLVTITDFTGIGNGDAFFDNNEVITITETVTITGCNNLNTNYTATFGCFASADCGSVVKTTATATASIDLSKVPNLVGTITPTGNTPCYGEPFTYTISITNNGTGAATNVVWNFGANYSSGAYYYQNFQLNTGSGFAPVMPTSTLVVNTLCTVPSGGMNRGRLTIPLIAPGQTITLKMDQIRCCVPLCGPQAREFQGTFSDATYQNSCGTTTYTMPNVSSNINFFEFSGHIENGPAFWIDGDVSTKTFTYQNGTSVLDHLLTYSGGRGAFVWYVTLPPSLSWTGAPSDITFLSPTGQVVAAHSAALTGNVLRVEVRQSSFPSGFNYNELATLRLPLTPVPGVPGGCGIQTISMSMGVIQDITCLNYCERGLGTQACGSYSFLVACPSPCPEGGTVPLSVSIQRTNLGLGDNNNDGLPNGALDLSLIALDRVMINDTFRIQERRVISNPTGNMTWKYVGAEYSIQLAAATRYDVQSIGGTFRVWDASAGVYYDCNTSVTATTTDVLNDRQFVFDWGAAIAAGCLPSGFVFDTGDSLVVNTLYRVTKNYGTIEANKLIIGAAWVSSVPAATGSDRRTCLVVQGVITYAGLTNNIFVQSNGAVTGCNQIRYDLFSQPSLAGSVASSFPFEYRKTLRPLTWSMDIPAGTTLASASLNITTSNLVTTSATYNLNIAGVQSGTTLNFNFANLYTDQGGTIPIPDLVNRFRLRILLDPACQVTQGVALPLRNIQLVADAPFLQGLFSPATITTLHNSSAVTNMQTYYGNTFINSQFASVFPSPTYTAPVLSITPPTQTYTAFGNTATWDVTLTNASNTAIANNVWLSELPSVNEITITSVQEINCTTGSNIGGPLASVNGIFQLGNMAAASARCFRITASFTSCGPDVTNISTGYDCGGYPTSVNNLPNSCLFPAELRLQPQTAGAQVTILNQPAGSVDLCSLVDYEILLSNPNLGTLGNVQVTFTLPATGGMTVEPGTSFLAYPQGGSYPGAPNLSDPIYDPVTKTFTWTIPNSMIGNMGGLVGTSNAPNNTFTIRFKARTEACDFQSGSLFRFGISGTDPCGILKSGTPQITQPVYLNGAPANPNTWNVGVTASALRPCGVSQNSTITITGASNNGPNPSGPNDYIAVVVPNDYAYAGNFTGISNAPAGSPVATNLGTATEYRWTIPLGVPVGGIVSFSFEISAANTLSCTAATEITVSSLVTFDATCTLPPNTVCNTSLVTGTASTNLTIERPSVTITAATATATLNPPSGENVSATVTLTNTGTIALTAADAVTVALYGDANGNGSYDPADTQIGSVVFNGPLAVGATANVNINTLAPAGLACPLFAVIQSEPCLCSASNITINSVPITPATLSYNTCPSVSLAIGSAAVSGYNYTWTPATNLSSPTIAMPNFTGPALATNQTYNFNYSILRPSVVATCNVDIPVTVNVNANPTVNAVGDENVCAGTMVPAITFTGSPDPGVVFNWTNNNTAIGLAASGTGNITAFTALNAGNVPVSATITVTPEYTNNGVTCMGTPITFTITVNPTPSIDVVANESVCAGGSVAITFSGNMATNGFYRWTNDNTSIGLPALGLNNIAAFTAVNAGNTPQVANIMATPVALNNGLECEGTPQMFTITVNPLPVVTLNDPADVCIDGSDMSFTATPAGGTFTTTAPAGFVANNPAGTATLDVSAADAGTYTVTYTYTDGNGCDASQTVTVVIFSCDYGDLADGGPGTGTAAFGTPANHQTLTSDGGPSHKIVTDPNTGAVTLKIGSSVDDEADGQPSTDAGKTAGGDDAAGSPDDEDGLDYNNLPLFILGQSTNLEVKNVMNMTGSDAKLTVFVDFNKDGNFDNTEMFSPVAPVGGNFTGDVTVPIAVPTGAVVGDNIGLRIRLANNSAESMSPTGLANSGEVEDYVIQVVGYDFGDLPDTYNTNGNDNPPRHIVSNNLKLGASVDSELDGAPDPMAGSMGGGDDGDPGLATFGTSSPAGDDENGIMFMTPLIPGSTATIMVDAMNMTGSAAVLQGWIDWNGDGDFDAPAEELVFTNGGAGAVPSPAGLVGAKLTFNVPSTATFANGNAMVRFRLSPNGGLSPSSQTDPVPFGEIEDYKLTLGKVGNYVWEDWNFNGIQEMGEPTINNVEVTLVWGGPNGDIGTGGDDVTYKPLRTGGPNGQPGGSFDSGEYYYCGLTPGEYKIIYTSPEDMTPTKPNQGNDDELDSDGTVTGMDMSMAMEVFTITDVTALPTGENGFGDSGAAGVGTFPDRQVDETHDQGFAFLDYGDLPGVGYPGIFYQTKMAEGGPIHVIYPGFKIGASVDPERDATVLDATAQGDDVDALADESGVVFPPNMVLAPGGSITITVSAMNPFNTAATLQGWIDWDNNGVLDPTDEIVPINVPVGGLNNANVTLPIPANADFDMCMLYARFRLSRTGGLGPNGPADKFGPDPVPQGEVEDYKRAINTVPPVMSCPADIVKNNDPGKCGAVITYPAPLADDECTGWTLSLVKGQLSGTLFPIGETVVEWKVTDLTGYMSSCSFKVTVNDTQLPTVTCPVNIVKWTAPGQCSAPIFFAVKGFSDNCAGLITPTIISTGHPAPGTSWPVGGYTVTYEVKDPSNNAAQCSFTVKVSDGQAPSISCPVNQTRNTDANVCTAVITYAPVVTDNCLNPTWAAVTPSHASGSAFAKGVTTVVLRATDAAGLTKTCTFRVTVNDRQAPSISCDAGQSVNTGAGQCSAVVTYNDATFTDNCAPTSGTAVRISGLPSGAAFPKGVTNVVYRATDASGNIALCSVKITVTDNEKPKITCPNGPISRNTDAGKCGAAVSYSTPVSTDNCPGVQQQLLSGLASGSSFPVGSTVVRWQAKDAVGLTEACQFTVTVVDNQLPTITCPPNTTVMGGAAPCTIAKAQLPSATAQDNCGVTSLSSDAPASLPAGATVVTWTAQDAANQQAQCQHTVTVMCQTGPNAGGGGNVLDLTTDGGLGLGLAPNPASESVLVTVAGIGGEGASLSVMDALGRTVWTRTLGMGTEQVVIDLTAQFAEGHYQVSLRTDSAVITKSLVVVKR